MSTYIIASSTRATDPAPRSMVTTLHDIAAALGVTADDLAARSVPLRGEWHGTTEQSRAILVSGPATDIYAMAYALRVRLQQDAVMVLTDESDVAGHLLANGGERVSIRPAGRREDGSVQTDGAPIVGLSNGHKWTTTEDAEYGTHVVAFI